jgi:Sulfotransferase family
MIISHSRKFIFLKTRKTGGTSVEIALSSICGQNDVITPITPRDELQRLACGGACRHFSNNRKLELKYINDLTANTPASTIPKNLIHAQTYYNHMTLEELHKVFQGRIDEYKIITIERHPYEKAVSMANFNIGYAAYIKGEALFANLSQIKNKIDEVIDSEQFKRNLCNWHIYSLNNIFAADRILQYDKLEEDFFKLCQKLGFNKGIRLPKSKTGVRDKNISAAQLLTRLQKSKIQKICANEFAYFGYET